MKVICIDSSGNHPSNKVAQGSENPFRPVEGEIYTVVGSFISKGYCWYQLQEDTWRCEQGLHWGWCSELFTNLKATDCAVNEATKIIELTPQKAEHKKWYQKIFS